MAAFEGKPLMEHDEDDFNDHEEASGYCGCFRGFRFRWRQSREDDGKRLLQQQGEGSGEGEAWLMERLRKVKEFSEVVAGPKWKTFIRKISGYGKKQKNRFQYDERSYALNFNSGAQSEDEEDMPPSFSTRFSAPFAVAGHRQIQT